MKMDDVNEMPITLL